jgi:hypothetical protein
MTTSQIGFERPPAAWVALVRAETNSEQLAEVT